jgi:hypothetical protein
MFVAGLARAVFLRNVFRLFSFLAGGAVGGIAIGLIFWFRHKAAESRGSEERLMLEARLRNTQSECERRVRNSATECEDKVAFHAKQIETALQKNLYVPQAPGAEDVQKEVSFWFIDNRPCFSRSDGVYTTEAVMMRMLEMMKEQNLPIPPLARFLRAPLGKQYSSRKR